MTSCGGDDSNLIIRGAASCAQFASAYRNTESDEVVYHFAWLNGFNTAYLGYAAANQKPLILIGDQEREVAALQNCSGDLSKAAIWIVRNMGQRL